MTSRCIPGLGSQLLSSLLSSQCAQARPVRHQGGVQRQPRGPGVYRPVHQQDGKRETSATCAGDTFKGHPSQRAPCSARAQILNYKPTQTGFDGFVEVSKQIMKGRSSPQQREIVKQVLYSIMPPGSPRMFRLLFPPNQASAEVNAQITVGAFQWLVGAWHAALLLASPPKAPEPEPVARSPSTVAPRLQAPASSRRWMSSCRTAPCGARCPVSRSRSAATLRNPAAWVPVSTCARRGGWHPFIPTAAQGTLPANKEEGEASKGIRGLCNSCSSAPALLAPAETTACLQMPTQSFFTDDFGLPLTMKPNFEDLSCEMIFGQLPPPIEKDEAYLQPCFAK